MSKSQSKYQQWGLKKTKQIVSANISLRAQTAPITTETVVSIITLVLIQASLSIYYMPTDQWDRVKNEGGFVSECAVCMHVLKTPKEL